MAGLTGRTHQKSIALYTFGLGGLAAAMAWYWATGTRAGFLGHMIVHVVNLALAAPLVALGLQRHFESVDFGDTGRLVTRVAVLGAVLELLVVWFWHMPIPHNAARESPVIFVIEQASVLMAALLIWWPAWQGLAEHEPGAIGAAVMAMFVTSMHMTLLGAVLLFTDRVLFDAPTGVQFNFCGLSPNDDQRIGATLMLAALGLVYLVAGLGFMKALLDPSAPTPRRN